MYLDLQWCFHYFLQLLQVTFHTLPDYAPGKEHHNTHKKGKICLALFHSYPTSIILRLHVVGTQKSF